MSDETVSVQLKDTMEKAIETFKKRCNGTSPQRIIVYRDGVSDSQKLTIYDIEIPQIRGAIEEKASGAKLIYLTVNKKVKTKVMTSNQGRVETPRPGTVLDHSITKAPFYEFYLVSTICR